MPRKKPITLAQVDKARANYDQALRTIIGRPGGRRYADSMRRALTARKRWARVRLAYNAQEFVPAKEQAAQAKASPRAGAAASGGLQGLRPAGIIVDELPQGFHGIHIHQGNTAKVAAAVNWALIGALVRAAHILELNGFILPSRRRVVEGLRAAIAEINRSPGRAE